jgi:replicative DNA helicase
VRVVSLHSGVNGGGRPRAVEDEPQHLTDVPLEGTILGSIIIKPALIRGTKLSPSDFASSANEDIFRAMLAMHVEGEPIDTVRLERRLQDQGKLAKVGGGDYLLSLTNTIPPDNLPEERLRKLACKRRMADAAQMLHARLRAGEDVSLPTQQLERAREDLRLVEQPLARLPLLADLVHEMHFDGRRLRTGINTLDEAFRGGIPLKSFGVLVGAPGAAKTTIATSLLDRFQRDGAVAMYLAADEARDGIVVRLGQLDGFPREGLESPHDTVRRAFAAKLRARPDLLVVDPHEDRLTLEEAASMLQELAGDRIRVIIVDSLQTIPCAAADAATDARDRMNTIIETCKRIAKRGAIVIAISEMSRGGYRTGDRATDTSALAAGKESGSIEYGANFVLGLRSARGEKGVIEVEVAKNRIGSEKPDLRLRIDFERASVHELDPPPPPEKQAELKTAARLELAKERIRAVLREHHNLGSRRDVVALAEGTTAHNLAAINLMVQEGEVVPLNGFLRLQTVAVTS